MPLELLFTPLALIADLPAPDSPAGVGWLMLALAALAVAGEKITGGILNVRKLKGSDPAADDRYATKDEHNALKDRVTSQEAKQEALQITLSTELAAIHRALGRIEGHLSARDAK